MATVLQALQLRGAEYLRLVPYGGPIGVPAPLLTATALQTRAAKAPTAS